MTEIKLHIPQISCGHCLSTIKSEINEIEGAEFVSGEVVVKDIVLRYDSDATLEKVKATLIEIGFFPVD